MRTPNVFSGPYLERAAHLRKDTAFLETALRDPSSLVVPLWHSRSLGRHADDGCRAAFLEVTGGFRRHIPDAELVMLGRFQGRVCFAAELPVERPQEVPEGASFEDLRLAGGLLPGDEAGLLAYARAMVLWRQRHRHCGTCGSLTVPASAGHVMRCSQAACGAELFPRLDPAIIVLVSDGCRALLGRQASWPAGRYSTLAGFVEPGESLEDAVAREVLEESGIVVQDVAYHSSQPWPFPSSLMLGFTATASAASVPRADEELEDVRWFTREELASGSPRLPPPQSVSYRLIEDWYDSGAAVPLRRAVPGPARSPG